MDGGTASEGLFSAIGEQAAGERSALIAEAEVQAREILARADAETARMRAEAMRRLDRGMRAEADRILGEARLEARGRRLAMKRRLIAEAFSGAREELRRLAASAEAVAVADALAAEALAAVGAGGTLEAAAAAALSARSGDGRTRVDNGLLSRLERAESREEAEVARILFGEPAP